MTVASEFKLDYPILSAFVVDSVLFVLQSSLTLTILSSDSLRQLKEVELAKPTTNDRVVADVKIGIDGRQVLLHLFAGNLTWIQFNQDKRGSIKIDQNNVQIIPDQHWHGEITQIQRFVGDQTKDYLNRPIWAFLVQHLDSCSIQLASCDGRELQKYSWTVANLQAPVTTLLSVHNTIIAVGAKSIWQASERFLNQLESPDGDSFTFMAHSDTCNRILCGFGGSLYWLLVSPTSIKLEQAARLPGVTHITNLTQLDLSGTRITLAAFGNKSLVIQIDLKTMKIAKVCDWACTLAPKLGELTTVNPCRTRSYFIRDQTLMELRDGLTVSPLGSGVPFPNCSKIFRIGEDQLILTSIDRTAAFISRGTSIAPNTFPNLIEDQLTILINRSVQVCMRQTLWFDKDQVRARTDFSMELYHAAFFASTALTVVGGLDRLALYTNDGQERDVVLTDDEISQLRASGRSTVAVCYWNARYIATYDLSETTLMQKQSLMAHTGVLRYPFGDSCIDCGFNEVCIGSQMRYPIRARAVERLKDRPETLALLTATSMYIITAPRSTSKSAQVSEVFAKPDAYPIIAIAHLHDDVYLVASENAVRVCGLAQATKEPIPISQEVTYAGCSGDYLCVISNSAVITVYAQANVQEPIAVISAESEEVIVAVGYRIGNLLLSTRSYLVQRFLDSTSEPNIADISNDSCTKAIFPAEEYWAVQSETGLTLYSCDQLTQQHRLSFDTQLHLDSQAKLNPSDLEYCLEHQIFQGQQRICGIIVLGASANLFAHETDFAVLTEDYLYWVRLNHSGFSILVTSESLRDEKFTSVALLKVGQAYSTLLLCSPQSELVQKVRLETQKQTDILYNDAFVDARVNTIQIKGRRKLPGVQNAIGSFLISKYGEILS